MTKETIFITDLDGTLVKDFRKVNDLDMQTIQNLKKQMKVGIATGRSNKEIEFIEEQTGITVDFHIGFNGAMIDMHGERIFEKAIDQDTANAVIDFIEKHEIEFDALDGDKRIGTYVPNDMDKLWNIELIRPDNLFEFLKNKKLYKINIRPIPEKGDKLLKDLQNKFPNVEICKSGPMRIEITPKNVNKGNALDFIRERYNANIVVAGDSENDVTMFQKADKAYCMDHADNSVKQYASTIIHNFYELDQHIID